MKDRDAGTVDMSISKANLMNKTHDVLEGSHNSSNAGSITHATHVSHAPITNPLNTENLSDNSFASTASSFFGYFFSGAAANSGGGGSTSANTATPTAPMAIDVHGAKRKSNVSKEVDDERPKDIAEDKVTTADDITTMKTVEVENANNDSKNPSDVVAPKDFKGYNGDGDLKLLENISNGSIVDDTSLHPVHRALLQEDNMQASNNVDKKQSRGICASDDAGNHEFTIHDNASNKRGCNDKNIAHGNSDSDIKFAANNDNIHDIISGGDENAEDGDSDINITSSDTVDDESVSTSTISDNNQSNTDIAIDSDNNIHDEDYNDDNDYANNNKDSNSDNDAAYDDNQSAPRRLKFLSRSLSRIFAPSLDPCTAVKSRDSESARKETKAKSSFPVLHLDLLIHQGQHLPSLLSSSPPPPPPLPPLLSASPLPLRNPSGLIVRWTSDMASVLSPSPQEEAWVQALDPNPDNFGSDSKNLDFVFSEASAAREEGYGYHNGAIWDRSMKSRIRNHAISHNTSSSTHHLRTIRNYSNANSKSEFGLPAFSKFGNLSASIVSQQQVFMPSMMLKTFSQDNKKGKSQRNTMIQSSLKHPNPASAVELLTNYILHTTSPAEILGADLLSDILSKPNDGVHRTKQSNSCSKNGVKSTNNSNRINCNIASHKTKNKTDNNLADSCNLNDDGGDSCKDNNSNSFNIASKITICQTTPDVLPTTLLIPYPNQTLLGVVVTSAAPLPPDIARSLLLAGAEAVVCGTNGGRGDFERFLSEILLNWKSEVEALTEDELGGARELEGRNAIQGEDRRGKGKGVKEGTSGKDMTLIHDAHNSDNISHANSRTDILTSSLTESISPLGVFGTFWRFFFDNLLISKKGITQDITGERASLKGEESRIKGERNKRKNAKMEGKEKGEGKEWEEEKVKENEVKVDEVTSDQTERKRKKYTSSTFPLPPSVMVEVCALKAEWETLKLFSSRMLRKGETVAMDHPERKRNGAEEWEEKWHLRGVYQEAEEAGREGEKETMPKMLVWNGMWVESGKTRGEGHLRRGRGGEKGKDAREGKEGKGGKEGDEGKEGKGGTGNLEEKKGKEKKENRGKVEKSRGQKRKQGTPGFFSIYVLEEICSEME